MRAAPIDVSYVLPLRRERVPQPDDLEPYLRAVAAWAAEVIVVDGSPEDVRAVHARSWGAEVRHLTPDGAVRFLNGKVNGVATGVRASRHDRVVIADDDVRHDRRTLGEIASLLGAADVVVPQNFFRPLTWHARWDTARTLINRALGGDYPGTLGVRRSVLLAAGGYDGDVLFENLELLRTIRAAGGRELRAMDLYVERTPPTSSQFASQRVRQAYDDLALPLRLAVELAIAPVAVAVAARGGGRGLGALAAATIGLAEIGRRRAGGRAVFPPTTPLFAPAWVAERGVCIWAAVFQRAVRGGVRYSGARLLRAATPMRTIAERIASGAAAWSPPSQGRDVSAPSVPGSAQPRPRRLVRSLDGGRGPKPVDPPLATLGVRERVDRGAPR